MPEIVDENRKIWQLLELASSQWRVGFGEIYGLDYGVIIEMAKAMNIEINTLFFEKLKAFEDIVLQELKKRAKK
jgi:hypothetical protein